MDKYLDWIKSHKLLGAIVAIGVTIIAIGNLTDAVTKISSFVADFENETKEQNNSGLTFYARYLPGIDGQTYGSMFYIESGELHEALLVPNNYQQMHADRNYGNLGKLDLPAEQDIADLAKISFSLVAINDSQSTAVIDSMSLKVDSIKELPERRIFVWYRKGLLEKHIVKIKLLRDKSRYNLINTNHSLELRTDESFPVLIDILDAEPGLYNISFHAHIINGSIENKIKSRNFTLASPHSSATSEQALHILAMGTTPKYVEKLLTLNKNDFKKILTKYNRSYATESDVEDDLKQFQNSKMTLLNRVENSFLRDYYSKIIKSTSGISLIAQDIGFSEDLLVRIRTQKEESKELPFIWNLETKALIALKRNKEALEVARAFKKHFPSEPQPHLLLWQITQESAYLRRAILLAPHQIGGYEKAANFSILEKKPLIDVFASNIKHVTQSDRERLYDAKLKFFLARDCGTLITENELAILWTIDKQSLALFSLLPEFQTLYKPKLASIGWKLPSDITYTPLISRLIPILISIGRLKVAERLSMHSDVLDDRINALISTSDYKAISEIGNSIKSDEKISGHVFAALCLSAIWRNDWDDLNFFLRQHSSRYPNIADLAKAYQNSAIGNRRAAKKQLVSYFVNSNKEEPFEQVFWTTKGVLHIKRQIDRLSAEKEGIPLDLKYEFSDLFASQDRNYIWTRWPFNEKPDSGKRYFATTQIFLALMKSTNEKLGVNKHSQSENTEVLGTYVRLPNGLAPLVNEAVWSHAPHYFGMRLTNVREKIANDFGKYYTEKGVYGHVVRGKHAESSLQLHHAIAAYWNYGALQQSLKIVDIVLEKDSNFFDAWRLKLFVSRALGLRELVQKASVELTRRWPLLCKLENNGEIVFK